MITYTVIITIKRPSGRKTVYTYHCDTEADVWELTTDFRERYGDNVDFEIKEIQA